MATIEEIMQVKSPYKSSPVKGATGPAKTAYNHISSVLSNIEQWKTLQNKGLLIVQSIQNLKLHEIIGEEYPKQFIPLSKSLVEAGRGMSSILEEIVSIAKQMSALAKLYPSTEPLINTWSASKLSTEVQLLCEMFKKELELKQTVIENICHCRDEHLTEVYVSSWEYNVFIENNTVSLLGAEVGVQEDVGKGLKSP